MQEKSLLKKLLLAVGLVGIILVVLLRYQGLPGQLFYKRPVLPINIKVPEDLIINNPMESVQSVLTPEQTDIPLGTVIMPLNTALGLPSRLKIPVINVDSAVEYVGITPDYSMDVPKDPDNVGWFRLGQRPGDKGSAVIAGHYGWKDDKAAIFDNLHKLRKGDKVYVENDKGETVSFVVREIRSYDPEADASDVFDSSDGESHLNLITCEGVWNATQKSYSKRLVVFTDKE